MLMTYLPDQIILKTGEVLKPVTFQSIELIQGKSIYIQQKRAKEQGLKTRIVKVLSRNLRGRTDLHGLPYKPTEWLFIEQKQELK